MPTLLALPDARRTPITRGEGRLGRSDYLVNWAGGGSVPCQAGAGCSGDPGDCLERGLVADAAGEPGAGGCHVGSGPASTRRTLLLALPAQAASKWRCRADRLRTRQVDEVGVTHCSLAGSRLDEALAFG